MKRGTRIRLIVAVFAVVAYYHLLLPQNKKFQSSTTLDLDPFNNFASEKYDEENSAQIKNWRYELGKQCYEATSEEAVQSIAHQVKEGFALSASEQTPPSPDQHIKRCKLVVLDFGANIGDTAGHVVDTGLYTCHRSDLVFPSSKRLDPRINTTSGEIFFGRRNPLTHGFEQIMSEFSTDSKTSYGSEDYCYYGIEGNPVFTQRLQRLQQIVMNMNPRPVKHLHFYTQSVGAGEVGMTKLYLDTVNEGQNFWGSSIFKSHGDVQKSAAKNDNSLVETDVMGYTISELLMMTMKQFNPDGGSADDLKGGHLLLKVDIEGGEYPLIWEAYKNGTLCKLASMGNRVDLFIEFHSRRVIGNNPLIGKMGEARKGLESCGAVFRGLSAKWA